MTEPLHPFGRYLAAKRTVDDHALNRVVWARLVEEVRRLPAADTLHVLEIGAGIGTMVDRLVDWGLPAAAPAPLAYLAIDESAENVVQARRRPTPLPAPHTLDFAQADLFDFLARPDTAGRFDLVIAHAFLDLVDIPSTLPRVLGLLRPGGLLYATINFDGVTAFEPAIEPALDAQIEAIYHETMDRRVTNGKPSGDSRTGRHLFANLRRAGATVLEAGSSDWLVFARDGAYRGDEAFFLRFIIDTVHGALREHPALDQDAFTAWVAARHGQIERGELVYLAHQLDFLCRAPESHP